MVNYQKKNKDRLDNYLVEKGYFDTKSQAQGAIMSGKVKINGQPVTKAGTQVKIEEELDIEVKSMPYVSRGAFKLEKAIKTFDIDVKDKVCLDIGASTGGFTDFMLQNGAQRVYAIDVGYGQLAWKLRQDERVVVLERMNVRNATIEQVYGDAEKAEFACIDVSFISVIKILENLMNLMNPEKQEFALLIKPQFEAGREDVPKSGVIRDKKIHFNVIKKIVDFAIELGLVPSGLTHSPIKGPAGNIEYLLYLVNKNSCGKIENSHPEQSTSFSIEYLNKEGEGSPRLNDDSITKIVDEAHEKLN